MLVRLLTTSAVALLIAGPAFADCSQDIEQLDQAVIEAETGASGTPTGLPATEHQQAVLAAQPEGAGTTSAADPAAAADTAADAGEPPSPHQQQVLEGEAKDQGAGAGMSGDAPAGLLAKARELAAAGDEQGCLAQVSELKSQLGIE